MKGTLYTLNTQHQGRISPRFILRPAIFKIQGCRKSEMHWMSQNDFKHLTVKSTLYVLNSHPQGANFTPFCSTTSLFRDTRLSKIRKCTEWPENDLKHLTVNSTLYTLNTHPEAQISLRFALRPLVFQIIKVFGFPIGYNSEFQIFVKNQKLNTSKIQSSTFVMPVEKKI